MSVVGCTHGRVVTAVVVVVGCVAVLSAAGCMGGCSQLGCSCGGGMGICIVTAAGCVVVWL